MCARRIIVRDRARRCATISNLLACTLITLIITPLSKADRNTKEVYSTLNYVCIAPSHQLIFHNWTDTLPQHVLHSLTLVPRVHTRGYVCTYPYICIYGHVFYIHTYTCTCTWHIYIFNIYIIYIYVYKIYIYILDIWHPRTRLCLKRVATSRRPHRRIFTREPINSFHLFLFRWPSVRKKKIEINARNARDGERDELASEKNSPVETSGAAGKINSPVLCQIQIFRCRRH